MVTVEEIHRECFTLVRPVPDGEARRMPEGKNDSPVPPEALRRYVRFGGHGNRTPSHSLATFVTGELARAPHLRDLPASVVMRRKINVIGTLRPGS